MSGCGQPSVPSDHVTFSALTSARDSTAKPVRRAASARAARTVPRGRGWGRSGARRPRAPGLRRTGTGQHAHQAGLDHRPQNHAASCTGRHWSVRPHRQSTPARHASPRHRSPPFLGGIADIARRPLPRLPRQPEDPPRLFNLDGDDDGQDEGRHGRGAGDGKGRRHAGLRRARRCDQPAVRRAARAPEHRPHPGPPRRGRLAHGRGLHPRPGRQYRRLHRHLAARPAPT